MNKTRKVALCISLVGIGVFVWAQVAAAGKPAKTPVLVTFLSGDVIAEPQTLPGPFTATIDFLKYIPFICPDSPAGGEEVLRFLQTKNPITYTSLAVKVSADPLYNRLDFNATIDGVAYTITMNAFLGGTGLTSTPELDTVNLLEGRFAIIKGKHLAVTAGDPVRQVNLDFTMTK
jgi:hypothetical protein